MNDYRIATRITKEGERITTADVMFVTDEAAERQDLNDGDAFPVIRFHLDDEEMEVIARDGRTLFSDSEITEGNDDRINEAIKGEFGVSDDKVIELRLRSMQTASALALSLSTGLPITALLAAEGAKAVAP